MTQYWRGGDSIWLFV